MTINDELDWITILRIEECGRSLVIFLLRWISSNGTDSFEGNAELSRSYYAQSCPRAEEIVKEQVKLLYEKHGNTAVSWLRNLFHDCMVGVSPLELGSSSLVRVRTLVRGK